ncbi:anti-sigma factor [Streptomyces sp. NPDC052693]|uniref:anti-sigma factor n=1 Tax=Streptomyces sp. NPDC052693 TaxID=3155814 RepID=UPI00342B5F82
MNTGEDLHGLTGAYALHALGEGEEAAFRRHLAHCASCRQEVDEFFATAARLGLAAASTPRSVLREQVLHRITDVRQEPPGTPGSAFGRRTGAPLRQRVSRWALAACVAGAVALGGGAWWQHDQADRARTQARRAEQRVNEISAVLAAPDARTVTARLGGGASGTVVVSRSRNQAVFVAAGMDRPPSGRVYQLWLNENGTMRPAGLLDPDRGNETVLLRGGVATSSGLGITVEPAGGSPQPTSAPIAQLAFPT